MHVQTMRVKGITEKIEIELVLVVPLLVPNYMFRIAWHHEHGRRSRLIWREEVNENVPWSVRLLDSPQT